jgi:2-oxopent-4-enoate/cis-2-oxohex-4-enoate hydratase
VLDHGTVEGYGDELFRNLRDRTTSPPLTAREPGISVRDAYHISRWILACREGEGERLVGKKIGVTSPAVQNMLGVHQPDFGYLTDRMRFEPGVPLPASTALIQPRAEGELAFVLARDLSGPGINEADVLAATDFIAPCFEIVDSRITDWKIAIQDTVADNASSGVFVISEDRVSPVGLDLASLRMRVTKNGSPLSEGLGSAALGSPLTCVAWLANTLGEFGIPLLAGEVILSGSWVPLEPVAAGDRMTLEIETLGGLAIEFQ